MTHKPIIPQSERPTKGIGARASRNIGGGYLPFAPYHCHLLLFALRKAAKVIRANVASCPLPSLLREQARAHQTQDHAQNGGHPEHRPDAHCVCQYAAQPRSCEHAHSIDRLVQAHGRGALSV